MRIVVLGTRGFPGIQGGVEKHCENLYPRLARFGCEVIVLSRRPYLARRVSHYRGVKLISLPCPKNKFLEAFSHTFIGVFAAKRFRPQVLHIHAIGPSLFAPLARLIGLKVIVTNHGPDYERKKWNRFAKFILRLSENLGARWSNTVICISSAIAHSLKIKYGACARVIANGVPAPEIVNDHDVLEKYGLEKGGYILSVGRLVPEKGFHDLMEAYALIRDRHLFCNHKIGVCPCKWKLVIVGDADHEDDYSRRLKQKAADDPDIVMAGFISGRPLVQLYSHAGLFVLPSYYEGLPIVLLEAASYGISCVVSDIPANREVDLPSERYFKAGDIDGMSVTIEKFMSRRMSTAEKKDQSESVLSRYNWDNIAGQVMDVYKSVLV